MSLDMYSLEGKVAIVTGGSRGLGQSMALGLADADADVVVASRTQADLDKVAEEIRAKGRKSLAISMDTTSMDSIRNMAARVVEEFGKIDKKIRPYFKFAKSYNSQAVEVNYQAAWNDPNKLGIPIFTIEDMYAGSNLFQAGVMKIGILPTIAYDANIFFSPGLGTLTIKASLSMNACAKSQGLWSSSSR